MTWVTARSLFLIWHITLPKQTSFIPFYANAGIGTNRRSKSDTYSKFPIRIGVFFFMITRSVPMPPAENLLPLAMKTYVSFLSGIGTYGWISSPLRPDLVLGNERRANRTISTYFYPITEYNDMVFWPEKSSGVGKYDTPAVLTYPVGGDRHICICQHKLHVTGVSFAYRMLSDFRWAWV